MCIILAVAVALGAAGLFLLRARPAGDRREESQETVRRLRDLFRHPRRREPDSAPGLAVRDPAAAAAALLVALAQPGGGSLSPAAEAAIRAEMRDVMALSSADETLTIARWIARQESGPESLIRSFAGLWTEALKPSERADLYGMAARGAAAHGEGGGAGSLALLHEGLGLTRT